MTPLQLHGATKTQMRIFCWKSSAAQNQVNRRHLGRDDAYFRRAGVFLGLLLGVGVKHSSSRQQQQLLWSGWMHAFSLTPPKKIFSTRQRVDADCYFANRHTTPSIKRGEG